MEKRFKNWKPPKIVDGKLTKYNWLVQHPENLCLGRESDIGAFTYINAKYGVVIGKEVQVGSHCSIYSISTIGGEKRGRVVLGKGCCIGTHSTVLPGIEIGENTIVGAHSLVNKNLPANVVAFGVPVKVIKKIAKEGK